MQVTLRPAVDDDAVRIAGILIGSRAAFMPYAPSPHPDDIVRAWVRDRLLTEESVTVGLENDQISGVIAVHQDSGITWISQLYLDPVRVGRGLGSLLLAHALRTALRPVRLHTFQANAGARRFYERNRFVAIAFSDGATNEERCPDVLYERVT